MISIYHPTKQSLVKSAVKYLQTMPAEEITSELVLADSGISKGSLYHHFEDFSDLIEHAQVYMFSHYVENSILALNSVLELSTDRNSLVAGLREVTRVSQSPEHSQIRRIRIGAIDKAARVERMRRLLGAEQEKLTDCLADLFRESQERGWGHPRLQPRNVAVLIQSYTIGKVVDDLTPQHMDEERWYQLIDEIVEKVLYPIDLVPRGIE